MSDLWIPPSARTFDDVTEQVIAESDDPAEARRQAAALHDEGWSIPTPEERGALLAQGGVMILQPRAWLHVAGTPVIHAEVGPVSELTRMFDEGYLDIEMFTVALEADQPMLKPFMPALIVELKHFSGLVPLEHHIQPPFPGDWRHEARTHGLGIAIDNERVDDDRKLLLTSQPMRVADLTIVPNKPKVGRNEKCPCGSSLKFKLCCGR